MGEMSKMCIPSKKSIYATARGKHENQKNSFKLFHFFRDYFCSEHDRQSCMESHFPRNDFRSLGDVFPIGDYPRHRPYLDSDKREISIQILLFDYFKEGK
jgi:hypothetical protein